MSILEKLGFKKPGNSKPVKSENPSVNDAPKENPHDSGGCCGGCGGTQEGKS